MDNGCIRDMLKDAGAFSGGPKITVIGGGTGLSVLLRGLKKYTSNITAIVTVADDGGSSGMLRQDYGILPPGDIRNCIMALANTEPIMEKLMEYRFSDGALKGQNFGNLLITALNEICGGFDLAVKEMSNVLAITGNVVPVTLEDITLYAELADGTLIKGESQIPIQQQRYRKKINRIFIEPASCKPMNEAIYAIKEADIIVLGPGSLYTSIIPNILVRDIAKALEASKALKIYVSNIMTQKGETIGYTLSEHIDAISSHAGCKVIDYVIANNGEIPENFINKYKTEEASPVKLDYDKVQEMGIKIEAHDFVSIDKDYVRHNYNALTETIFDLFCNNVLCNDINRLKDYYFIYDKAKACETK